MNFYHPYIIPCGILLISFGLFLRYHIGRRRFNRRGMAGMQHFSSYGYALLITFIESFINLLGAAGIFAGAALVLIAHFG